MQICRKTWLFFKGFIASRKIVILLKSYGTLLVYHCISILRENFISQQYVSKWFSSEPDSNNYISCKP